LFTARMMHATVGAEGVGCTGPGPQSEWQSKAGQVLNGKLPSTMFTPLISSVMSTAPSPLQSPTQTRRLGVLVAVAPAVAVMVGVTVAVAFTVEVTVGSGVSVS